MRRLIVDCHPEQGDGSWRLPTAATPAGQARTRIPRFARD